MPRHLCALGAVALALASCTLGPDYRRPPIDAPQAFRFQVRDAHDTANTAWWEQFGDPTLDRLIGVALADNLDVKTAAARIDEFLGQYMSTRSLMLPQVGASLYGQRQRLPETQRRFSPGIESVLEQYEAALSVSWEIDVFGRLRRETEAARAAVLSSEEGRRATILTLVASVASTYIALRELERQLEIAKSTAESRKGSYLLFKDKFEGGVVSELELAQTLSEYEASLVAIPQIEARIGQQENALSILLGHNPGPIGRGQALPALGVPAIPAGLPSQLLVRRPDLRQAEQDLIAANALIGAARAQYFPTISLTGLLGSLSGQFSDLFKGPAKIWSYAANVSMPIFTGGGIAGQVHSAEARQQQALFRYQKSIQVAFQEVSDSLIGHTKAREQLVFQERQVKSLRNYLDLARLRYDEGYTSYIEVLDAERNLFNAELSYSQTQGQVLLSLVNLYKAMGGGWVTRAEAMAPAPASILH
jgi:outer membrane protein, multidrug efflux system